MLVKTQQRLIPILMTPQRQILSIKIDELRGCPHKNKGTMNDNHHQRNYIKEDKDGYNKDATKC